MNKGPGKESYSDIVHDKKKVKRSILWNLLHLLKKRSPKSSTFWAIQYLLSYLQIIFWPFSQLSRTRYWGPNGLFDILEIIAKIICGQFFASWGPFVFLLVPLVILTSATFVICLFKQKANETRWVTRCLAVFQASASRGLVMICLNSFGSMYGCDLLASGQCTIWARALLHFVGTIGILCFLSVCFLYVLACNDTYMISENIFSRIPGPEPMLLMLVQVVLVLSQIVAAKWISIGLFLGFSATLYYTYVVKRRHNFYDSRVEWILGIAVILLTVSTGAAFLIEVAFVSTESNMSGSLLWLMLIIIGVPAARFIGFQEHNKFAIDCRDTQGLILLLLQFVRNRNDQSDNLLMLGSAISHIYSCPDPYYCPIKLALHEDRFPMTHEDGQGSLNKFFIKLLECAFTVRDIGNPKTPSVDSDGFIELIKAQFLIDVIHNRDLAAVELRKAANIDGFLQCVWQKMLWMEITYVKFQLGASQGKKGLLQIHLTLCKDKFRDKMIKSAKRIYHMWQGVAAKSIPLEVIEVLIRQALKTDTKLKKLWSTFQTRQINVMNKFFYEYLKDVVGDVKFAQRYLQLLEEREVTAGGPDPAANEEKQQTLETTTVPIVIASKDLRQLGIIKDANLSACQLFGFTKEALIGLPVSAILPALYRNLHKQSMENAAGYAISNRNSAVGASGKKQKECQAVFGFGVHRNSYIIPVNIQVFPHAQAGSDVNQFMATFALTDQTVDTSYLIADPEFILKQVSSNAVSMLGISERVVREQKIDVRSLFPLITEEYMSQPAQILEKPRTAPFFPLKSSGSVELSSAKTAKFSMVRDGLPAVESAKMKLSCGLIEFSKLAASPIGYYFRVQKKETKTSDHLLRDESKASPRIPRQAHFRFRYEDKLHSFVREWAPRNGSSSSNAVEEVSFGSPRDSVAGPSPRMGERPWRAFLGRKNFAGVVAEMLEDVFSKISVKGGDDEENKDELFFAAVENYKFNDSDVSVKLIKYDKRKGEKTEAKACSLPARLKYYDCDKAIEKVATSDMKAAGQKQQDMNEHLRDLMQNKEKCAEIIKTNFRLHPLLWGFAFTLLAINLTFVVLGINQFTNVYNANNKIKLAIDISQAAFEVGRTYVELLLDTFYLSIANSGNVYLFYTTKKEMFRDLKLGLQDSAARFGANLDYLSTVDRYDMSATYRNHLFTKARSLTYNTGNVEVYSLVESLYLMLSGYVQLMYSADETFVATYPQFAFVTRSTNRVSTLSTGALKGMQLAVADAFTRVSDNRLIQGRYITVTGLLSAIVILLILGILIFLQRVRRGLVCGILYTIKMKDVRNRISTIKKFVQKVDPEMGRQLAASTHSVDVSKTPHQKKERKVEFGLFPLFLKIVKYCIIYVALEGYYIYLSEYHKGWSDFIVKIQPEYNQTGYAPIYYYFCLNGYNNLFIDRDAMYYNYLLASYLPEIIYPVSIIDNSHRKYGKGLSETYNAEYERVMNGNACEYAQLVSGRVNITKEECESALDGVCKQGLFATLEQLYVYSLEVYYYYAYLIAFDPNNKAAFLAVVNRERVSVYQRTFRGLVHPLLVYLREKFTTALKDNIDQYGLAMLIALVVYLVCMVLYQFLVTMFVFLENKNLRQLTLVISIIPNEIAMKNERILKLIRQYLR